MKCRNTGLYGAAEDRVCVRERGHFGLHRDTVRINRFETAQWGDNEGKPEEGS